MKAAADLDQDPTSLLQLNFDQYERYAVVREIADLFRRARGVASCRVLDVGGFSRHLDSTPFLPVHEFLPNDDCVVYDLHEYKDASYIRGDGVSWPFLPESFDIVTTCDTLEHVPPQERSAFIERLLDTSKDLVILAAPFEDTLTNLVEQIYLEFHRKHHFLELAALEEHQRHSLPHLSQVTEAAEQRGLPYYAFPSGYLPDWLLMAFLGYATLNLMGSSEAYLRLQELYNRSFCRQEAVAPGYRRVVVISKAVDQEFVALVRERFPVVEDQRRFSSSLEFVGAPLLLAQLLDLRLSQDKRERLVFSDDGWHGTCGEIAGERSVRRRFVCSENRLGRVDFLFGTYGRSNRCDLVFRLLEEGEPPREVARLAVPARDIEDNRWRALRFPPVHESARKFFWAELTSLNAEPGIAVTVYCDGEGQPYLRAYCLVEEESRPVHVALAEKEALLAQREGQIARLEAVIAEGEAVIADRESTLRALRADLESIRGSTWYRLLASYRRLSQRLFPAGSWRGVPYRALTAPARWLLRRRQR